MNKYLSVISDLEYQLAIAVPVLHDIPCLLQIQLNRFHFSVDVNRTTRTSWITCTIMKLNYKKSIGYCTTEHEHRANIPIKGFYKHKIKQNSE